MGGPFGSPLLMNQRIVIIAIILVTIGAVFLTSNFLKSRWNHTPGSFVRLTKSHLAIPQDTIQLSGPSFSIIGHDSLGVSLIDRSTSVIYTVDEAGRSLVERIRTNALPSSHVSIANGQIYIANESIIHQYKTNLVQSDTIPGILTAFVPMPHDRAAIRIINPKNKQTQLGIISFNEDSTILSQDYPQPGLDSLFSVDGMLSFSTRYKRLVYVHYYKNEILHLDSMLRLSFKSQSIDTTTIAKIQVALLGNKLVMATPPPIINKSIWLHESALYIQSAAIATNETPSQRMDNSTIDVYDLQDGRYMYSFYLQHLNGLPISQFTINRKVLYALHRDLLIRYQLGM